uniref:Uncharacterized protein n=1 Tax=Melanthalia intermedia TaxID=172989 RepID=A0A345UB21_9FLOR|nr:hypothetical protein [Melanthalia intermedia]AXI97657.1 hypothetical protein [Melanthalia intermedia]
MIEADNFYALIIWKSFASLPNIKVRLLDFHFFLSIKMSSYFTEFTVDCLLKKLYIINLSNPRRVDKKNIRTMLSFFIKNQSDFIDFDFDPIINSSYNLISGIRIHRSKLLIL